MGRQRLDIKKTLAVILIALFAVLVMVETVSAAPSKGNYHFITPPHSPPGAIPGGSSWGVIQHYPTLYDDYGRQGKQRVISNDIPDLGNGCAASIMVPSGYCVIVYEDTEYHGKSRIFDSRNHDFNEDFYGGSIQIKKLPPSSGKYHFITTPPPPPGSIPGCSAWGIEPTYPTFYDDFCIHGNADVLPYDISDLGNGIAASIDIPDNYVVTVYENTNYQGKARTFVNDMFSFPEEFYGGSVKLRKLSPLEVEYKIAGKYEYIVSPETIDEILNEHNKYRNELLVSVPISNLSWDEQLAASAQKWADHLTATNKFEHSCLQNCPYGESIAWGNFNDSWTSVIDNWAAEKKCFQNREYPDIYDHSGQCNDNNDRCIANQDSSCVGHYSQIIWSDTQRVGCGRSGNNWVCQYSPGGNVPGQKAY